MRNEAESGSRFRIAADVFAFPGFVREDYSTQRRVGYMSNRQLPCQVPFNLKDSPSFAWRTGGAEKGWDWGDRCNRSRWRRERENRKKGDGEKTRVSTTDPDARKRKMANGGYDPAFDVQLARDADS